MSPKLVFTRVVFFINNCIIFVVQRKFHDRNHEIILHLSRKCLKFNVLIPSLINVKGLITKRTWELKLFCVY